MLGQPASSHTVCRPSRRTRDFSSVYSGPILARVLIHEGLRSIGVCALRTSSRWPVSRPLNCGAPQRPPTVALVRKVKDETNLDIVIERQVGRYDATGRDPRGHIISAAYLCRLRGESQTLRCREDAGEAHFVSLEELRGEDLAFDHEDMLVDAERLLTGAAAG